MEAFNTGYYEGGSGGVSTTEFALPKPTFYPLPPKVSDILAVVRSHTPGLRHIYNNYLRILPGIQGKVTLRFAIAPSGHVVDIALVTSTTESADFDREVLNKILSWRFDAVKAFGNDIVTVPFNFSE